MINNLQELALFGYTNIGRLIDKENISQLLESLIKLKQTEIEKDGIDTLKENNFLESVWNLPQKGSEFLKIIDNMEDVYSSSDLIVFPFGVFLFIQPSQFG